MIKMPSYRLGAEELIELGRARTGADLARRPFFQSRPQMGRKYLGDLRSPVNSSAVWISGQLERLLGTLSTLVSVPLGVLSKGAGVTFGAVSTLFSRIPATGHLMAQAAVLGAAAMKLSIPVPGLSQDGLKNILGGIGQAFGATQGTALLDEAKTTFLAQAPSEIQGDLAAALGVSIEVPLSTQRT